MLLSKEVKLSVINNNKKYLLDRGYDISNSELIISIEDLPTGSKSIVSVRCDICGNDKEISYYNYNKSIKNNNIYACSSKCSNIKKRKTNLEKFGHEWATQSDDIKNKIKSNNLEKYNTICTLQVEEFKQKSIKSNLEKYGYEHPSKSDIVKSKTVMTNFDKYGKHPSKLESTKNKNKKTNLEKYGVDNPIKNKEVRYKSLETKLEKYGDVNYNNREKFKITNIKKYGKFYTQTEDYKEKSISTSLEKWGVEHPSKSEYIKDKIKKTKLDKYGKEGYNNIDKISETNLLKYGCKSTLENKEIREKIEKTNLFKYGVKNIVELDSVISNRIKSYNNRNREYVINTYSKMIPKEYKIINYINGELIISHNDHEFISSLRLIYDRLKYSENCEICTKCNPIYSNSSTHENEIADWLIEIGLDINRKDRNILNGQELDIYIPTKKIAIEFNGLYWHSELFKDKWYHLNKTINCNKNGIDLIHVFEDDWRHKKDVVKSIIKNRIGYIDRKIWARNCYIKNISLNECKSFLNENHIQGYSRCKHKLGLFFNNELVSVMTFGYRRINSNLEFELIRFCNKKDINVLGSASKLLKYFINENNYSGKIVSYSDISIFKGNLYEKLGFKVKHISKPNYYWVINNIKHHRFKFNKKKLVEKYGYDKDKTEWEIMSNIGGYKIWSCGQIRFELIVN